MPIVFSWDIFVLNEAKLSKGDVKAMAKDQAKVEKLARLFAEEMKSTVKPADFKKAIELNKKEPDDVCRTHDFCDANMVMDAAFKKFGIDLEDYSFPGRGMTGDDNVEKALIELWNAAWKTAKSNHFYQDDKK